MAKLALYCCTAMNLFIWKPDNFQGNLSLGEDGPIPTLRHEETIRRILFYFLNDRFIRKTFFTPTTGLSTITSSISFIVSVFSYETSQYRMHKVEKT